MLLKDGNNRVSIKHTSVTRLTKHILREQAIFRIGIEQPRTGEQSKKKIKILSIIKNDGVVL